MSLSSSSTLVVSFVIMNPASGEDNNWFKTQSPSEQFLV